MINNTDELHQPSCGRMGRGVASSTHWRRVNGGWYFAFDSSSCSNTGRLRSTSPLWFPLFLMVYGLWFQGNDWRIYTAKTEPLLQCFVKWYEYTRVPTQKVLLSCSAHAAGDSLAVVGLISLIYYLIHTSVTTRAMNSFWDLFDWKCFWMDSLDRENLTWLPHMHGQQVNIV